MKYFLTAFFLLLVIISTFSYSVLYYSFNLTDNYLSQSLRQKFLQNPLLRQGLRLNQTGDARYDLATSKHYKKLKIYFYYQDRLSFDDETISRTISEIKKVVNKPGGISIEESSILLNLGSQVSDEDLKQLVKMYPISSSQEAVVQVFALNKYDPVPTYAGLVIDANNIFLFQNTINEISESQDSTERMEVSTILHEFGHLLGAEHVKNKDCILFEKVENLDEFNKPSFIAESYCQEDIEEIKGSTEE